MYGRLTPGKKSLRLLSPQFAQESQKYANFWKIGRWLSIQSKQWVNWRRKLEWFSYPRGALEIMKGV